MAAKGGRDLFVADGPGSEEQQGFAERRQRASPVEAEVLAPGVFSKNTIEMLSGESHSAN